MAADPVLSRELKSLQEELSATRRERREPSADETVRKHPVTAAPSGQSPEVSLAGRLEDPAEAKELGSEFRDLVKELTDFVQEAEANISAHPAMSIVAAMLLGILVGSLLARR